MKRFQAIAIRKKIGKQFLSLSLSHPHISSNQAIEMLMEKKGKFDYILLETTGIADPGPVASIFWLDDELGEILFIKRIIEGSVEQGY